MKYNTFSHAKSHIKYAVKKRYSENANNEEVKDYLNYLIASRLCYCIKYQRKREREKFNRAGGKCV